MKNFKDRDRWTEMQAARMKGHLAQALLLSGGQTVLDEVVGALTRQLLCERDAEGDCICRSCNKGYLEHPDVVVLDPSPRYIGRDAVAGAVASLAASPLWSGAKVIVIRQAETLGRDAESYLLKHLEEPPRYAYYLLATTSPDAIIATIRSRCHHWRFSRDQQGKDNSAEGDFSDILRPQKLTSDGVIHASYWARTRYLETQRVEWLLLWETLETVYRDLEANGNAEIAQAQLRRAWPVPVAR